MASEDPWSVPIGSPLVGIGRLARTIFILGASLSFAGSWGAVGGLVASGAAPLLALVSFSTIPYCWASSKGLLEEGRTLAELAFPSSSTSEEVSILELAEPGVQITGG